MSVVMTVMLLTWSVSIAAVAATYFGCLVSKRVRLAVFG